MQFPIVYIIIIQVKMVRIIDNYILYEQIGQGEYGKVYRAINKLTKGEYAVKVIEIKKFQKDRKLEEYTSNQITILSNIDSNPHIIGYFDMIRSTNNFYFVYEYCNGGTLHQLILKEKQLEESKALLILKDLIEAFKVLTKFNVMHRDLKPENIFFKDGVTKIGDFGFCKSIQKTQMAKTMIGSPLYMAPEVLNGEVYCRKADIWSIGVVLYEMLYGQCPFQSSSISKLVEVLASCEVSFPETVNVSAGTKRLIRRILTKDPKKRIQWEELFQVNISVQGKLIDSNKQKSAPMFLARNSKQLQITCQTASLQKIPEEPKKFKRQQPLSQRQKLIQPTKQQNKRNNEHIKMSKQTSFEVNSHNLSLSVQNGFLQKAKKESSNQTSMKFISKNFKF